MRNASQGASLPPVLFDPLPEPLVIETDGDSAWLAWDSAVRDNEANTAEGRALALMEMPA